MIPPKAMFEKIISGGQTGADRAALDFALKHDISHGGWCPRGRLAEDGIIPPHYQLQETPEADSIQRTEWNVRDSDGIVIFSIKEVLSGGSKRTAEFAAFYGKPYLHFSRESHGSEAVSKLKEFLDAYPIRILNVAGPRASEEPEVGDFVQQVLEELFYSTATG
ncbi:MAG: hypothetical protein JWQ71_3074 [Pedosphaera sp.]|nr:hypothetical protein [Pedosphaera sp.]